MMSYIKPDEILIINLNKYHRIEAGEYAWIFAKRLPSDNRYRFQFNSTKLLGLLYLIREHCIRRSTKNNLADALKETNKLIEVAMQSHAMFLRDYLPKELEVNKANG
jgi:hypothetical protein